MTLRPEGVQELEKITSDIIIINLLLDKTERIKRMKMRGDKDLEISQRIKRDEIESVEIANATFKSKLIEINCSKPINEITVEIIKIIRQQRLKKKELNLN